MAKPAHERNNAEQRRARLLNLRSRLRGESDRMADAALSRGRGETSSLPIHLADLGSDNFEQELTLSLVGSEKVALDKIDLALQRVDNGSYGTCEECGKKNPRVAAGGHSLYDRLRALRRSPGTAAGRRGIVSFSGSPESAPLHRHAGRRAADPSRVTCGANWPRPAERPPQCGRCPPRCCSG